MSLKDKLTADMKDAMKAREAGKLRLSVIRLVRGAIRQQEIDGQKELSDEDKEVVIRSRRIIRFLSQPMFVAEKFTGIPGIYVPIEETVRGFAKIVDGEMDEYPEAAFYNVGVIEDVPKKAETLA